MSEDAKAYRIFCLVGVIIAFNVAAISAIVPAISKEFGISEFVVGKIIWAYMLPYGICALFYGPLTRKFAIRDILIFCLSMVCIYSFFSGIANSFKSLFIFRLLVGIFAAAMTPLTLIYISHSFELEKRGKAVGTFFSITFISSLTGLFLSGVINWRWIFFIPAAVSIIAIFLVHKFLPQLKIKDEGTKSRYIEALKTGKVFRVFVFIFLVSFLYHAARQWMGVYFDSRFGFSQFTISMLLTLVSFAGIFGEFSGGHMADKAGRVITLRRGALLMAFSLLLLPLLGHIWFLSIIMFVWGLGWTINHSGLSTYLTDLPKPFLREASSLNSSVRFISGGLGAALGGMVMQRSFVSSFIVIGAILLILALSSAKILRG